MPCVPTQQLHRISSRQLEWCAPMTLKRREGRNNRRVKKGDGAVCADSVRHCQSILGQARSERIVSRTRATHVFQLPWRVFAAEFWIPAAVAQVFGSGRL